MLECENIEFKYGTKLILSDISLQFNKGHLYGILGPNGSGKTTLIKILSGILKNDYGKVFIDEDDIKKLSIREIAKKLAVVSQSNLIEFDFTVKEIIKMGRYAHVGRFERESSEDKKIINEIITKFRLNDLKNRNFNQLSGGEQQKVILARAMAQQSKIILLDEPTTHLDINYQLEFMEMLKEYVNKGLIIIIVLHDLNIATQYCDKIILLKDGLIKSLGDTQDIITRENIKSVYDVDVIIKKNAFTNSVYITPIGISNQFNSSENGIGDKLKIHMVAGGGVALELLPKLKNYSVTVGVINELDDDLILARELNYEVITEAPFSPISDESTQELNELLKTIDLIILSNIPIGKGNLKNLKILNESNKNIIIHEITSIKERDFTGGLATKLYNEIKNKKNVKVINDSQKLIKIIESMEVSNSFEV